MMRRRSALTASASPVMDFFISYVDFGGIPIFLHLLWSNWVGADPSSDDANLICAHCLCFPCYGVSFPLFLKWKFFPARRLNSLEDVDLLIRLRLWPWCWGTGWGSFNWCKSDLGFRQVRVIRDFVKSGHRLFTFPCTCPELPELKNQNSQTRVEI